MSRGDSMKKTIEKVEKLLEKKVFAEGAFIFGSYTRNPKAEHNDIDIFVLINENWAKRESKKINGLLFEIFYQSEEMTKKILYEEKDFNQLRRFNEAKILFDKNGFLKRLIGYAKKIQIKKINSKKDKAFLLYLIGDSIQDIQKEKNKAQKMHLRHGLLDLLLKAHSLSKKQIPAKRNYQIKKLETTDKKLHSLVEKFLLANKTVQKQATLKKIQAHCLKGFGKPTIYFTSKKVGAKHILKEKGTIEMVT